MTSLLALVLVGALDAGVDGGVAPSFSQLLGDGGLTWSGARVRATNEAAFAQEMLEDGWHVRFGTSNAGPVHVWWPSSYRAETATTVIYLHGYTTDVDGAFLDHRLAAKFRDSGLNALFIVPEAPSWRSDPVYWAALDDLFDVVAKRVRVKPPHGHVTVVGHSGAYRTVASWLNHARLSHLILLDALYASEEDFHGWLALGEGRARQLVFVGIETVGRTEAFLKRYPNAVRLPEVPYAYDALTPAAAKARVLFVPTDRFDHMGLIEDSRLLPWLLHTF